MPDQKQAPVTATNADRRTAARLLRAICYYGYVPKEWADVSFSGNRRDAFRVLAMELEREARHAR